MAEDFNEQDFIQELIDSFRAGAAEAIVQMEVTDTDALGGTNEAAAAYAAKRAAQTVKDISETTEEKIKEIVSDSFSDPDSTIDSITEDIDASGIFSPDRAALIARTEVARAQMQGTMSVWQQLGVEQVDVLLSEDNPCDECAEIADGGPYNLTDPVILSFPFHPNCQCTLVVVTS